MMPKGIHGNFCITLNRGANSKQLMVGNLTAWLQDKRAKPTKQANRFVISGWSARVDPIQPEVMAAMHQIFGEDKYIV